MRKLLGLSVLLAVIVLCGVAQAADLTINDGYNTYDLYFAANVNVGLSTGPVSLYGLVDRVDGCVGWMTYQSSWAAFKIIILEDDNCWGWTVEGHWTGDGSPGTVASNVGLTQTVYISVGTPTLKQAPGTNPLKKR